MKHDDIKRIDVALEVVRYSKQWQGTQFTDGDNILWISKTLYEIRDDRGPADHPGGRQGLYRQRAGVAG